MHKLSATILFLLLAVSLIGLPARPAAAVDLAVVRVDAGTVIGTSATVLSTQLVYPGFLEGVPGGQSRLSSYGPPLVRLHAGTDGCCWAGGPPPALPAGVTRGDWNFSGLDQLVGNVRAYGAAPVLNVRYAPNWMWTCTAVGGVGVVRDQTFGEFADYLARLVAYYNQGRMTTETGAVIINPAGTANRITYWELWNEPDLSNETPCHPADWSPPLTPATYLTMWNAVAAKMLAVDPSIKLIGPATAGPLTGVDYLAALMPGAVHKPDVVSFHAYGGWENGQSDSFLFDGDAGCPECGLKGMLAGLTQVQAWAPGRPVWVTELNTNAAYGDDPARRPWTAFGAAWGASAFRGMVLGGAALLHQYQFTESPQFGMVDAQTGSPLLPYWRDYYLARAFPPGSTLLAASSSTPGVEVLAARAPGSTNIHVLVVNRQPASATAIGGSGLPTTAQISITGISGVTAVSLRTFDDATPLPNGPPALSLAPSSTLSVSFSGYGAAILDVTTGAAPAPTATPIPTPAPTAPSATPAPTATPPVTPAPTTPAPTAAPGPTGPTATAVPTATPTAAPPTPAPPSTTATPTPTTTASTPTPIRTATPPPSAPSPTTPGTTSSPLASATPAPVALVVPNKTPPGQAKRQDVGRVIATPAPAILSSVAAPTLTSPNAVVTTTSAGSSTKPLTVALASAALSEMTDVLTRRRPDAGASLTAVLGAERAPAVMLVLAAVGDGVRSHGPVDYGIAGAGLVAFVSVGWFIRRRTRTVARLR